MLKKLIEKNRSYRRFHEDKKIGIKTLREFVDISRLTASGANLQPLKYIISNDIKKNSLIFSSLTWAGYLKDWDGPEKGERPAGYIIVLGDTYICKSFNYDCGIAIQSILLSVVEKGFGGCVLGAINRKMLCKELNISDRFEVLLVIALGKPKEKVVLERMKPNGDIKYWRDSGGVHHVPKRPLDDIIIG